MNIPLKYTERCTIEYFCELEKIKLHAPTSIQKIFPMLTSTTS